MFPRIVNCEDCGQIASVRGYGRIEYRWPERPNVGRESSTPTIDCIRLTVDCPTCGVKTQDFYPKKYSDAARRPQAYTAAPAREVHFRGSGPINRPRT
jgi:hypothetical protein